MEILTPRGIIKIKSIKQYILLNMVVYILTILFIILLIYICKKCGTPL